MKRVLALFLGVAALLASPQWTRAAPGDVVVSPDWARKPSWDDLMKTYPVGALRGGVVGKVKLGCKVAITGRLEQCAVLEETPSGYGFGAAALAMTPYFTWRPQIVNGVPIGGAPVIIPINFGASSDERDAVVLIPHVSGSEPTTHLVSAPVWASQATPGQIAAAFPRDRLATVDEESVTLQCRVLADGAIGRCTTTEDDPSFKAAAQNLAKYYRVDLAASEKQLPDETYVDLHIRFRASAVAGR